VSLINIAKTFPPDPKDPLYLPGKCNATTKNSQSKFGEFRCRKRAGHKDAEHVDMRAYPTYRWKDSNGQ
jgi:hypothetical protein